jgi:hypothetical protein
MKIFYRICLRHMGKNDNCFLFWCNNSSGYTRSIEDAGVYEEKETSKNDPIVSKDIVDKFKKKVRLPIYGDKEDMYAERNEFYVLPNTGQVRKSMGITTLDIHLEGNRDSFNAYFKDAEIEKFKYVYSKTHYQVKAKNRVSEYWYMDDNFEAENRNQAISKAFNTWLPSDYDNYIDFKKDVTCSRVKIKVLDEWVKI